MEKIRKNLTALLNCSLFEGMKTGELDILLDCLGAREKTYEKDGRVFAAEETPLRFGIVLSGALLVVQDDFWGNRSILERIEPRGLFGTAFVLGGFEKLPVSVTAAAKTEVLVMNGNGIARPCRKTCAFHSRLIRNMMENLARRNVLLVQKIGHITRRSTREKLLSYLSSQALKIGNDSFEIPFNRQELADYLAVDRSAMSSELGRMRDEGLLDFHKNRFALHKPD
ncbi:MAG: Crp/Fnr family transcriptional regulator [Treponema sp.]|jgi:CRP-like cAMP-binding protein|nr:Crp/Fnr family transcriptional regulator [Treponema sp.]